MSAILNRIHACLADRKGVTVVEYAILVAFIITLVTVAVTALQVGVSGGLTGVIGSL